jgi:hypothetical protein
MKRLSIFLLPLLLAGCAQKVPVPSQYDYATLKYDTTTSKADVIADLGVPTRTIKVSDTQTAYQWDSDNGSTSTGSETNVSNSTAFTSTDCLGCGFDGDSTTVGKTSSSGDVETHVCHLTIVADNDTDKVVTAKLGGTVDAKCYQHFANSVHLDPNAVARYKDAVAKNEGIGKRRKIGAALALIGGGAAVAASN